MAATPGGGLRAEEIIRSLRLEPHPEGGHYRETFRDPATDAHGRSVSTSIYYLLRTGELSRWHRVDACEVWHWYGGATLELRLYRDGTPVERVLLGTDLDAGAVPQAVVPAGVWQSAGSLGEFTLVGCTVAPGFLFAGFELAPDGFDPR